MTLVEREHVLPTVEDVTLLRHHSGPSVPKSLQKREGLFGYGNASFLYRMIRSTVFQISPHSMDALGTLGIVTSPVQVTRSDWEEIVLETTLEFHGAGTTYVVALRLSLRDYFGWEMAACFSAGRVGVIGSGSGQSFIGTAASHHAVGNTPRIPGTFLDLENYGYISTNMHSHFHNFFRPTYISTEITVGSGAVWGGSARLLRIALQHPFATPFTEDECPSHFWLSIDISEEHPYASRTELKLLLTEILTKFAHSNHGYSSLPYIRRRREGNAPSPLYIHHRSCCSRPFQGVSVRAETSNTYDRSSTQNSSLHSASDSLTSRAVSK